jgi:hypothetical protein
MPTTLEKHPSRSFDLSLPPTNRITKDTFRKVDGAGCVTAAGTEEPGKVFTLRLYIHRSRPPLAPTTTAPHHHYGHQIRNNLNTTTEPAHKPASTGNPGSQTARASNQAGRQGCLASHNSRQGCWPPPARAG